MVVRLGITLLPGGQMDGNSDKTASLHPTLPLHTLPCPMLYCLSRLAVLFQWWNGSVQMGRKEQYIFHKGSGDHPRRIHQSGKGGCNPPTWVDAVILGQWSDWERVIGNISNKRLWQWEWGQGWFWKWRIFGDVMSWTMVIMEEKIGRRRGWTEMWPPFGMSTNLLCSLSLANVQCCALYNSTLFCGGTSCSSLWTI